MNLIDESVQTDSGHNTDAVIFGREYFIASCVHAVCMCCIVLYCFVSPLIRYDYRSQHTLYDYDSKLQSAIQLGTDIVK